MWNEKTSIGRGHSVFQEAKNWLRRSSTSDTFLMIKNNKRKRIMFSSAVVMFVYLISNIHSSSLALENIRRILCIEGANENVVRSSYIHGTQVSRSALQNSTLVAKDFAQHMRPPSIPGRRPIPSHIELCQAFLQRRDYHIDGAQLEGHVHVTEDESVCADWSTPFQSLLQIFSGEVINQVSQKYGVTYSHDCQRTHVPGTEDGLDWTTIQQEFPPSGLVLDDGSVTEQEVVDLCKGCLAGFNSEQATASVNEHNPNPNWFNPHSTHHCIMYPGTSRTIVNAEQELDLAAVQQQRERAQHAPLGKVFRTIQDRLKLAASKHKLENIPSQNLADGTGIEDEEEFDGAVIYLDEGSMPMSRLQVAKNIPKTVKSISILIGPLCLSAEWEDGETCINYANTLKNGLQQTYPDAEVDLDVAVSSAAATSRMIRARTLVCPPGTSACLIPAMAKEEASVAVVGESTRRFNTEQFFDFLSASDYSLQIANVDNANIQNKNVGRSQDGNLDLTDVLDLFATDSRTESSGSKYVDGCVELRGRIGDWEQDYVYADLASEKNALLRGSSVEDVVASAEQGQRGRSIDNENVNEGLFRSWTDGNPECGLDMLNVHGLCEIVHAMKLGVVQFVGDEYTEEMVKSFWALLGIDDGDLGEVTPTTTDPKKYRKTVHCPEQKISFDIVFTPNESLTDLPDPTPIERTNPNRYVPVSAPVAAPVVVGGRTSYTGPGVTYGGNWGRTGGTGSCWMDPYGSGCGCDPAGTMRTVVPVQPPMPQYNSACNCIPFQQQYQYNYATAMQQPMTMPVQSGVPVAGRSGFATGVVGGGYPYASGRQFIVGGVTPNQPIDQFVNSIDQFGRTVTNTVDSNDIVVLRTGVAVPEAYEGNRRRTKKTNAMTQEEIQEANDYLHRSVHEYRRRARQTDLLSYDPAKSKMPYVHVLDVAHMTHSHPLANAGPEGRRHLEKVPNLYDNWNHLLYTNMRDIAAAELARQSKINAKQHSAPLGSPYENAIPIYH